MVLRLRSAFELQEPVAHGGMGEVWRATHLPSSAPVAIKLAMGDHANDPDFAAHFRNEVHAAARLDHPHVIRLFDHGEIDEEVAAQSGGRLAPGTPWMAMEWASKGTLSPARVGRWSHLRRVLLTLLDALAHAHARGVIHRDIKPSNVIICGEDALRPGLKLADFGIAAPREAEASPRSAGTRYYSAPEQVEGRFRDQGPWTDLYSVGCLAIELSTGWKRLLGSGETLVTRFAVPADFTSWVRRLLTRDERGRWAFAADAARRLVALGDIDEFDALDPVSLPIDLRASLATLPRVSTQSPGSTSTNGTNRLPVSAPGAKRGRPGFVVREKA